MSESRLEYYPHLRCNASADTLNRIWYQSQLCSGEVHSVQGEPDVCDFLAKLIDRKGRAKLLDRASPNRSSTPQPGRQLSNNYEFVCVRREENHESLAAMGISPDFLRLSVSGCGGLSRHFRKWAGEQLGRSFDRDQLSPRVADALLILEHQQKYSLSPWSGSFTATRNSLGPNWYLFERDGGAFISGQISGATVSAHDTVWILPDIRKILYVEAGIDLPDLESICSQALSDLWQRSEALFSYLDAPDRKVLICDWPCDHFGHYVWNVISAWGSLFEMSEPARIRAIGSWNAHKYFGPIKEIFGGGQALTETSIASVGEIYDLVFDHNLLLCSIRAHFISRRTADRVVGHSLECCDPAFKDRLDQLAADHWPVLLFSLRLENRAWVDQIEGFAEIAERVLSEFTNAAFVIHGLSANMSMGSTTSWMSLNEDLRAAVDLESRINRLGAVLSAVGLSIHESVAIAHACDAFVAPVGSGMALYKWLTNKPGVAFSNRFCSDLNNPRRGPFAIFDGCRPDIVPARYVPLSAVTDVEVDRHGLSSRANFTLNRSILYDTVRTLLQSLSPRGLKRDA